ncbi:MAG: formiminoglutamase [Paraglaciecola sp.]|jgi:formiminoglutamase
MSKLDKTYQWQGREDSEDGEQGLRWHQVLNRSGNLPLNRTGNQQGSALVGFACDLGVKANKGRMGAKNGPNKIRDALANLAWHGKRPITDQGTIIVNHDLAQDQAHYAHTIAEALTQHCLVIGLGGGHEIAWGSYQGLLEHLESKPDTRIGIINFDAHFDLRKPSPSASSGTPFRQIAEHCQQNHRPFNYACLGVAEAANTPALFAYAKQLNVPYLLDRQCELAAAQALLTPFLADIDELYVTICLDAFPAHIAPGVSAPSALGISPAFVIDMIHWLAESEKALGYHWHLADIAEMNPLYDQDNRTAKLAARLIFEILKAKADKESHSKNPC